MTHATLNLNHRALPYVNKEELDLSALKMTALIYLSEARALEAYETMPDLIRYAREFGAAEHDVAAALEGS